MAGSSTIESRRRGPISSPAIGSGVAALLLGCVLATAPVSAFATGVEDLLARNEAPQGVIFEIVEDDETALREHLPAVRDAIARLRQRFPRLEFAVVSHGREEFALQSRYRDDEAEIHAQVRALVDDAVPVHVCETHAGWYGVTAEDFPAYVDVAPSGPAQISLYEELGYELIVIR